MSRCCAECDTWCDSDEFSNNQWRKGPGNSRCTDCVNGWGRTCAQCSDYCMHYEFSNNQWNKGEGSSRCKDCVESYAYSCGECGKTFQNQNNLNMHMQVHRSRTVSCPVCGEMRFKSGANAVQHVESGYCSGCRGGGNARNQIYEFAKKQGRMRQYLTDVPMLTNGGYDYDRGVPEYPYCCPVCSISFRNLSQLMQHQDQKHNNHRMLTNF